MKKTLHRISVAYAYEWRVARLKNQADWWFGECRELRRLLLELLGNLLMAPLDILMMAVCAVCWLPYCFILRPIKYGIWNGEDVDKVEGWKHGRKKQSLIST